MNINYFGEIDINLNNVTFNAIKFDDVLQSANSGIIFLFLLTLSIRRCLETLEVGIVE
jgi:NADH:ubiquinone oxidoreductase subunit K